MHIKYTTYIYFRYPSVTNEWQRYKAGDAYVQDIGDKINANSKLWPASRDVAFWLKYLPSLSNFLSAEEHSEQIKLEKGKILNWSFSLHIFYLITKIIKT